MISFKKYLSESYEFKNIKGDYYFLDSIGIKYRVNFYKADADKTVEIVFEANGSTSKTNTSPNSYKVFKTISDIVDDYIKNNHPHNIWFTADKLYPSRVKLYDKLSDRLATRHHAKVKIDDLSNIVRKYLIKL